MGIDSPKNDSRIVVRRDLFPKNGFYQVDLEATVMETGLKQVQQINIDMGPAPPKSWKEDKKE